MPTGTVSVEVWQVILALTGVIAVAMASMVAIVKKMLTNASMPPLPPEFVNRMDIGLQSLGNIEASADKTNMRLDMLLVSMSSQTAAIAAQTTALAVQSSQIAVIQSAVLRQRNGGE